MPVALPDLRDGLIPWSREILRSLGRHRATSDGRFLRTIKLIAPIGDRDATASVPEIYATLLRLARDWVCRYPLVQNQGNIGSIDGDPPAGMRYNEMRLTPLGEALLGEDRRDGPLAGPFPNLLCNGAWAHGGSVATELDGDAKADLPGVYGPVDYVPLDRWTGGTVRSHVPPHNLGEVAKGLMTLLDHPRAGLEEVLERMPAPDFPTGGLVASNPSLRKLYETGIGTLTVHGNAGVGLGERGRKLIVISEMPFGISKIDFIEQIVQRVHSKEFGWVSDVRDHSSQSAISVELVIRRGYDEEKVFRLFQDRPPLVQQLECKLIGHRGSGGRPVALPHLLRYSIDHRREALGLRRNSRGDAVLRKEFEHWAGESDERRTRILPPENARR